jgi:hypothetical protein
MTKIKAPLSIDAALARIAGQFEDGYKDLARIVDRHESTIRAWGNDDKPDQQISLPIAIALDIAYQKEGGEGRPLFETYALQVEVAREQAFAGEIELMHRVCLLIKEGAEANEAVVLASLPSATPRDRAHAMRQLQDVVREATSTIALLSLAADANLEPPP